MDMAEQIAKPDLDSETALHVLGHQIRLERNARLNIAQKLVFAEQQSEMIRRDCAKAETERERVHRAYLNSIDRERELIREINRLKRILRHHGLSIQPTARKVPRGKRTS